MENFALNFDISALADAPTGSSEDHSFDTPIELESIKAKSNLTGKVKLMRLDDGVNAGFSDLHLTVEFACDKCLKTFTQEIAIDSAKRQILFEKPEDNTDPNDIFLVDSKNLTVDLTEPLRQEIILHFPVIPVCSSGCKGICPHCGQNRNQKQCNCKDTENPENKPLAALKDLIKE